MSRKQASARPVRAIPTTVEQAQGALAQRLPEMAAGVGRAREAVAAARKKLGTKGRIAMTVAGLLALAGAGSVTVNHVARPATAVVAQSILGPGYVIMEQGKSGRPVALGSVHARRR